jgi:hypothetical protein
MDSILGGVDLTYMNVSSHEGLTGWLMRSVGESIRFSTWTGGAAVVLLYQYKYGLPTDTDSQRPHLESDGDDPMRRG